MSKYGGYARLKPETPAAGQWSWWIDSIAKIPCIITDDGRIAANSSNASIAAQGAGFSSDTYVTGSNLIIPSFQMQAKTLFHWRISVSKTAAGTATPVYSIRIGTAAGTSDTARLQLTGPAQSAAADIAVIEIIATVRSVGTGTSGVIQGTVLMAHNLAATGFATAAHVVEGTSAGFDNSDLDGSYIGLSIDGGASAAWTITQVRSAAIW